MVKNKYNLELCFIIFNFCNQFIPFIRAGKNMFKDRNITILGYGIITLMYTVLTLNMLLQAEKLLLSQYNNIKMFV